MKSVNPYSFIHTGLIIRLLRHAHRFSTDVLIGEASRLEQNLKDAGFAVSTIGLQDLLSFTAELKKEPTHEITPTEVSKLEQIMALVEKVVFAEAQTKRIFVMSETRFNTDHLVNAPDRMFAQGAFAKLPSLTKYDIMEAFQCLIHARATAVAFHSLRATESVLQAYYEVKIKRGRLKTPMWGNMVTALRTKRDRDENLLQRLDFIRVTYRNPTVHPEEIYPIQRAEDLVGLCIEVINTMAASLPEPVIKGNPNIAP